MADVTGIDIERVSRKDLAKLLGLERPRKRTMIQWLQRRGWKHDVDAKGWPIVLHKEVELRLTTGAATDPDYSINLDAFKRAG